jgi:glycosyltransferase involved in cell wall biosynthesis
MSDSKEESKFGVKEGTIYIAEKTSTYKRKQINWEAVVNAQTAKNAQGNLELIKEKVVPFEAYPHTLPHVSIITVTRNRKHMFPIAIQNWLQFTYPRDKLEWVIIDDSDKPNQDLHPMLEQIMKMGHDIKYVNLNAQCTVGKKRNIGVEICQHPYVMMMDDDDVYYPDSILAKLSCIITYGKKIAFSRPIAVYDTKNDQNYILEGFEDVPEASVMMTKEFWTNHAKFDDVATSSEGHALLTGHENYAIQVPFFFNFLCIQHGENATRRMRSITNVLGRRGLAQVGKMQSLRANKSFFKELPKYFRDLINQVLEVQKELLEKEKKEKKEDKKEVGTNQPAKKKNKKKKNKTTTQATGDTNEVQQTETIA